MLPVHKNKKPFMSINIDCEILTQEICHKILESIIKYALYQCQQIPLQIDILAKEVLDCRSRGENSAIECEKNVMSKLESDNQSSHQQIRQRILLRREELAKKNHERKRNKWIPKVKKFLRAYENCIQILKRELGGVDAKNYLFVIGGSTAISTLAFKITFESSHSGSLHKPIWKNDQIQNPQKYERQALLHIFRSFVNHPDLVKLLSGHIATSKFWTLVEKKSDKNVIDLVPKTNFNLPQRTKVIEIIVKGNTNSIYNIVDMELTPCVKRLCAFNVNESFLKNKQSKISLFQSSSDKSMTYEDDSPEMMIVDDVSVFRRNSNIKFGSSLLHPDNERENCHVKYLPNEMEETPVFSRHFSTNSSIQKLSKELNFTANAATPIISRENNLDNIWYILPEPLVGFKDICLNNTVLNQCV